MPFIHASKCLMTIMYRQMAVPEGHLSLFSVCCEHWLSMFLGDRRMIMFLCSHLLSHPKSHFLTVAKLKRNHCQMDSKYCWTAHWYQRLAPNIPSLWVLFLLFNYIIICIQSSCCILGMKWSPKTYIHYSWVSCLGYWELSQPMKSLQVTEVMLLEECGIFVSSTSFSLCPCEERSFAKRDASHGSQNSGASGHGWKLGNPFSLQVGCLRCMLEQHTAGQEFIDQ